MKTPPASKIIEEQSSPASIHEVQKLIECEKKRRLIEIADMWEGVEAYKHPMTIQIRVEEEQGYSVIVEKHDKKNRLNPSRALYDCEGVISLFDRLVDVLDLSNEIEVQVKVKED